MSPTAWQRLEAIVICAAIIVAMVVLGLPWWWVFVLFLVFDASMVGYLGGPRAGAFAYNAVHNYAVPAALGVVALITGAEWVAILAFAWGFHVAADRGLGYGLKHNDGFEHTHLGLIGKRKAAGDDTAGR